MARSSDRLSADDVAVDPRTTSITGSADRSRKKHLASIAIKNGEPPRASAGEYAAARPGCRGEFHCGTRGKVVLHCRPSVDPDEQHAAIAAHPQFRGDPRRRVLEASQLRLDGMVQQGGRARGSADDHAARPPAYVRELGCQFGGECPCRVADAGPQRRERHAEDLRRSVRSDLDAVAVNLDAKIADSVQTVSKAPAERRRKRRISAV